MVIASSRVSNAVRHAILLYIRIARTQEQNKKARRPRTNQRGRHPPVVLTDGRLSYHAILARKYKKAKRQKKVKKIQEEENDKKTERRRKGQQNRRNTTHKQPQSTRQAAA